MVKVSVYLNRLVFVMMRDKQCRHAVSDLDLQCLFKPICRNTFFFWGGGGGGEGWGRLVNTVKFFFSVILTITALWARNIDYIFLLFSQKTGYDISCKLSHWRQFA